MNSNSKFWTVFLLGVGMALGCVCGLALMLISAGVGMWQWQPSTGKLPLPQGPAPRIGQAAPDFELTSLAGERIHLYDLRGQPVVINFWASWCHPCTEEMPIFQQYSQDYPTLQLLAVNAGESLSTVEKFAAKNTYTFDILIDPGEQVNRAYRATAIPVTYFLDAEGAIAAVQIGSMTEKQFAKYLQQIGIPQE